MTELFSRTHTSFSPWIIVRANNKKQTRLEYPVRVESAPVRGKGISIGNHHPGSQRRISTPPGGSQSRLSEGPRMSLRTCV